MKTRTLRARLAPLARQTAWPQSSSSLWVLASLGLLSFALPHDALAQRVIAPATLPVLRGVVSGQAVVNAPVPGAARPQMTIDQASQRAIINWRSFDIGSNAEALFRHQQGTAASTLNRIFDANPSLIQGRLRSEGGTAGSAGGQVILINQNGIIFGRGAQVNTQSLIASTLNLDNERFLSGALAGGGLSTPAFEGGYDADGNPLATRPDGTRPGNIVIGGGNASAAAPVLQAGAGGSIMIFAPSIDNQGGIIKSPDGQVILAAGSKAYLAINPDVNDITLRGYVVEIEAAPDGEGLNLSKLVNAGEISADRGNVTLAALAVNQEGRVSATTALQANGSIYLKAHTKDKAQSGTVNFKASSVTEVTPDAADTATVPDSQAYLLNRGVVDVSGRTIENHGTVRVPGGLIKLVASSATDPEGARVYLGAGSETSVAGAWADVDFAKNLRTFRVTSNELKNSPDQKTGILRGAVVSVDLRQDNNILDLSGYRGLVARTVTEKAAAGGELQISSSGSVVQRAGAVIDASGGGYRYNGGTVNTSRLLGADGKIYDIATADEQRIYTQLLDNYQRVDTRWGQTTNIANPLGTVGSYQGAYVEGKAGGLVSIDSKAGLVLDGTLKGGVTVGPRQMTSAPRGATLTIGSYNASQKLVNAEQRVGNITWQQQASDTLGSAFSAYTPLTDAQRDSVTLGASQLFGQATQTAAGRVETGFGTVELNSSGRIVLPTDVNITSDAGAELILRAQQIDVAGDIRLPGGNLTLQAAAAAAPLAGLDPAADNVIVRSGASLSTAGAWVNTSNQDGSFVGTPAPTGRRNADGSTTRLIDGGELSIEVDNQIYRTRLEQGATLDVGGGASLASSQRVTAGNGGKLSIANGVDNQTNPDWLQADLRGFSIGTGGELSLKMARAVIDADGAVGVVPEATTRLEAGLFADHGFSKLSVETAHGIDVVAGTALKVEQKSLVIDPAAARQLVTGGDIAAIASVQRLPDSQRGAASVVLNAKGSAAAGDNVLTVNEGASIVTDPKGEISLSAADGLSIGGRLSAPGGKIGITLNGPIELGTPDLHIGAGADISTAGVFVSTPNDRGLVQGSLLNGGAVTIDARNAGLQLDAGSRIDVSGVNQTVDVLTNGRTPSRVEQTLQGHAGTLTLRSQGDTVLGATLLGHGGSATAAGGSFALELTQPSGQPTLPDERRIVVTPGNNSVMAVDGLVDAQVNVAALTEGGFEKLRLLSENRIEFQGSSTLAFERGVRLDAPLIDLADGARVNIEGATVALGQSLGARVRVETEAGPSYDIVDGRALPVLDTRSGTGELTVKAGAVDMYGSLTINGAQRTRVESGGDIRLVGVLASLPAAVGGAVVVPRQIGGLTTEGDIELHAAQVYPATRTEYSFAVKDRPSGTLAEGGRIEITSNGNTVADVYSAAGKLSFEAQTIRQAGTVKAPHGQIDLLAGASLELAGGSVTSVSGEGLTVLYGRTIDGTQWNYVDGSSSSVSLDAVTQEGKHITLSAPTIQQQADARIDLSGGGDVLAVEFVPGNGGDNDITLQPNTYAIIPTASLSAMPFDNDTLGLKDPGFGFSVSNGRDNVLYDSIRIGAGGAVPAGEYTLLPARYALLPDAYLVELQTGSAYKNMQLGQNTALLNGQTVLAGFRTARGTSVSESQSVGVVVRPGAAAVQRASDYNLNGAAFFADAAALERTAAPAAPWDAGRLAIDNANSLALNGSFETAAATSSSQGVGRGAEFDINARNIAVVDRLGDSTVPAGFLQIEGASLSALDGSVLLGGKRSNTDTGIRITTNAEDSRIVVANSSANAVSVPELMLAAGDSIDIRAGSVLSATGAAAGTASPATLSTEASGALVRLSSGSQTTLNRGTASDARGDVRIAEGASLSASQSLLIDATRSTESRGSLRAGGESGAGGSVSLSSGRVSLGETDRAGTGLGGLVLSNADLAAYGALDELVLRGYSAIDLIGSTTLGSADFKQLTLDTPLLRGEATAEGQSPNATIAAREVNLLNSSTANAAAATGAGSLEIRGEHVVVGAGAKGIAGFASVRLAATDTLRVEGEGSLNAAAELTLSSPRVLVAGGAQQTLSAADTSQAGAPVYASLTVTGAATTAAPADANQTELGGRLTLEGRRVEVGTTVQARSGQIHVASKGTGVGDGVTLTDGALLDARGQARDFNGKVVTADGGSVSLTAAAGPVAVQAGARVDVSAAEQGGGAGRLTVRADSLSVTGELAGRASAGATSGSADIDLAALGDFSDLNARLNAGGFAEARSLRVRSGDINVAAADTVAARKVTLAADAGRVDVAGTVGTGAATGGAQVNLFADTGIALAGRSRLLANASAAGARGGEVRVATRSGALAFDEAAEIDVRAGEAGAAGSVIFGVSRDDNNVMAATRLQGRVLRGGGAGQASVDVEATRSYTSSNGSVDIASLAVDHAAFVAGADTAAVTGALRDETGALQGARVLGATEVRSDGDLLLNQAWDLTNDQWLASGQPGTLTLRAAGNLRISQSLGSPNDNILAGDTWNLRLAAGADLSAANPLAVRTLDQMAAGSGSLTLEGANAKLRTGTGRIDLAAARDVRIDNVAATIYTAGRIGAADTELNGNNRWAVDGGGISIHAGGDLAGAVSAAGDLWVTEWLRRPARVNAAQFAGLQATDWWSYRPRFQQGVGTLGGGDMDITTGGSISHLAAMLPTTGRTYRDGSGVRQVDVQGGGNLSVRAGEDVVGSSFLVGRGTGHVEAAGDVGVDRKTQLYVMGVSSGAVPEASSIDVVAGGSLALQSVSNPTAMFIANKDTTDPATGPSFATGGSNNAPTFFTYSSNSSVGAFAKSGDLSYQATLPADWRTYTRTRLTTAQTAFLGAFPASLEFVAFDGDMVAPATVDLITTFPSSTATVSMLAGGSMFNVGFHGSDRDPATVITPTTRYADANSNTRLLNGLVGLRHAGIGDRIVSREVDTPYVFDIQALEGSLTTGATATAIEFTAAGRVRAGVDITGANLKLQNLQADDVTEVRADTGDFRDPVAFQIGGPGRLLLQAGRNVDLGTSTTRGASGLPDIGGLVATGNSGNSQLLSDESARLTVVAGVTGTVNLAGMDDAYAEIIQLTKAAGDIIDLYRQLGTESDAGLVLGATSVAALAARDPVYARFVALDQEAPRALAAYQNVLRSNELPLGPSADSRAAATLYRLLNAESDLAKLRAAGSLEALAATPGGAAYSGYVALDQRYPRLFADYVRRRSEGALPTGVTPMVYSNALAEVVAQVVAPETVQRGDIVSYGTSIQTNGGSDIDLWAPGGDIVVGLTTPRADKTVGVLTNAGGAIRSVLAGDFNINQGKVLSAQGGDILLFSSQGSIDAGRGAKTSLTTPPPQRTVILDADGNQIGVQVTIPASAAGSGIQTLSSDPDGLGPLPTPKAGDVLLSAPAGSIDAGEAGVKSGGGLILGPGRLVNTPGFESKGPSSGIPAPVTGSFAASLASSGGTTDSGAKAAQDAAKNAADAARAATTKEVQKPKILTVEVLGFGENSCKGQDCFAK